MDRATKDSLREILSKVSELDYIKPENIPEIALYMDQVTTFMEGELSSCKRHPDDKLLTKTMINNYTKNDLLPPPEKKKYSKDHLILLIFIYYLKSFLSIGDIQKILHPLIEHFCEDNGSLSMKDIYRVIFSIEAEQSSDTVRDVMKRFLQSKNTFRGLASTEEEEAELQFFSFICMLSFDVYVKKQIIEHMIDLIPEEK